MAKGRIIFLNGLTSCGKTSVAEQMRTLCSDVLYVISNDIFHDMVDGRFFEEDFWKIVAHTITAQYYAARGMAEAGFTVVIDGMLLVPHVVEVFADARLHPSALGFQFYAENLVPYFKKILEK